MDGRGRFLNAPAAAWLRFGTVLLVLFGPVLPGFADDTPFFPIGIYGAPIEAHPRLREMGFTLVVGGYDTADFDSLRANRLRCLSGYQPLFPEVDTEYIRANRENPELAAWYIRDEPDLNRYPVESVRRTYALLKEHDPDHPALVVVYNPDRYREFFPYCDIFAVDPYPIMTRSDTQNRIENVYYQVAMAKRLTPEKPVWAIVQAFAGLPYWQQPPTPVELRNMVYQALAARADGILYYSFSSGEPFPMPTGRQHWYLPDDTPLAAEVVALNRELQQIIPLLQTGTEDDTLAKSVTVQAGANVFSRTMVRDGKRFILLVNTNRQPMPVTVNVRRPAGAGRVRCLDYFTRQPVSGPPRRPLTLPPLGVRILEFE